MGNGQLSKRFFCGANNSPIYLPATPEYDFFIGGPERQRKLVKLMQAQVSAQYEIAESIQSTNSKIAREIERLSADLNGAITNLSANISQVGDSITAEINRLEYSMVCEFRELRWLISQVGEHLEEVIVILKKKRKFEANELLEQALLNFKNGYYQEAKDRLTKAIEFDNTDYQIHRNLGFVFLHDDNGYKAIEHFQKAVAFSPNSRCKIDALADLSRTFYAIDNYTGAIEYLKELFGILSHKRNTVNEDEFARLLYNYSVYSGLVGDTDACVSNLDKAIQLRRNYFVLASIDQDFKNIKPLISKFLGEKVQLATQEAESNFKYLLNRREVLGKIIKDYDSLSLNEVDDTIRVARLKLANASYTDLIDIKINSFILSSVVDLLEDCYEIQKKLEILQKDLSKDENKLRKYKEQEDDETKRLGIKEKKSAESRKSWARIVGGVVVIASFVSTAAIAVLFTSASWKGCYALNDRPYVSKGVGEGLGEVILILLWAIFNLALIPASIVAPFWVSIKVRNSMNDYVAKAGEIKRVDYSRPQEQDQLCAIVSDNRSQVTKLEHELNNLKSKASETLKEIFWTVKEPFIKG